MPAKDADFKKFWKYAKTSQIVYEKTCQRFFDAGWLACESAREQRDEAGPRRKRRIAAGDDFTYIAGNLVK